MYNYISQSLSRPLSQFEEPLTHLEVFLKSATHWGESPAGKPQTSSLSVVVDFDGETTFAQIIRMKDYKTTLNASNPTIL